MDVAKKNTQESAEDKRSLRGTFASLLVMAAVIVVMWAGVFWFYMERV